jgi:hypothetical protein
MPENINNLRDPIGVAIGPESTACASDFSDHAPQRGSFFTMSRRTLLSTRNTAKRRRKSFPLLTESREIAREEVRKHGHPKKLK